MSKVKRLAAVAAPIVGAALGGPLGAAIGGAIGGAANGGGLKGALIGGATGGLAGPLAGAAGLGVGATTALSGAIGGAGQGLAAGGGLKSALTGAALGGAGGFISSGAKVPGFGNSAGASLDQVSGIAGLQGPTQGSGILGNLTSSGNLSVATGGGASSLTGGQGGSSLFKLGSSIFSGLSEADANRDIQKQLLAAQSQAQEQLQPYQQAGLGATNQLSQSLTQGFNPEDLQNDPGYQFRLGQGQQAIDRSLAAQGLGQSGAAIKASQDYAQGLADQTYGDAYNRYLQQNQQLQNLSGQGLGAASGLSGLMQGTGEIQALTRAAQQENLNRTLSQLLTGRGAL
jgi:hypothetical protein